MRTDSTISAPRKPTDKVGRGIRVRNSAQDNSALKNQKLTAEGKGGKEN